MSRIYQGIFYKVMYQGDNKTRLFESNTELKINAFYRDNKNNRIFKVLNRCNFRYTLEDIDNIRVMMEDHDVGTVQSNLCERMNKAYNELNPAVRFTNEEKELMSYMYYEDEYLDNGQKETLAKVLGIKIKK